MSKGVFITGTDTGIGKTVISCGLLKNFNKQGWRTAAMKPVASGAGYVDGKLRNEDALALQQAASEQWPYDLINPYVFEPAVAPHLAAAQAGVEIRLDRIRLAYEQLSANVDVTVVEGVGGWLVPLNRTDNVADLAVSLELPVILVVGIRLGCLNHALLTEDSIQRKGVKLIGWIANMIDPEFTSAEDNIETLRRKMTVPLLGVNLYQGVEAISFDVGML
ncbi:MAG: dethiobiotin synthase [Gammaproteobacteria bacterium]|nr:dethiobiotin synthase [Gammaproteobacteria bacterium]